jgi:hypothetical protein
MTKKLFKPRNQKKFYMILAYVGEGCSVSSTYSNVNCSKAAEVSKNVRQVIRGFSGDNCRLVGQSYGEGCMVGKGC